MFLNIINFHLIVEEHDTHPHMGGNIQMLSAAIPQLPSLALLDLLNINIGNQSHGIVVIVGMWQKAHNIY